MHPIEHLRYVARARGADPVSLVRETAYALGGFGHEPAGLVLAARRIVQRHPACGPLWWLCSHAIGSLDPFEALSECQAAISSDPTPKNLCDAVPLGAVVCVVGWPTVILRALEHREDVNVFVAEKDSDLDAVVTSCSVVIIEALAAGPTEVLCNAGSKDVVARAHSLQKPVWLVTPCGTCLPIALWTAMVKGSGCKSETASDASADESMTDFDLLSTKSFAKVVSKSGVTDDLSQALVAECPPTTELLRHSAM